MKNKKMTSKTITVIATLVIMFGFTAIPNVSAHTDSSPYNWFSSKTQSICYNASGIAAMKFDGSTPNTAAAKAQIIIGQNIVNTNTNMILSETTSCSGSKNWVTSYYDPTLSNAAFTTDLLTSGTKTIYFNNNQYEYWVTNGNCAASSIDLSNIASHEFGHFAGMKHQTGGPSHTMMGSPCDSGTGIITSSDISYVNSFYP